jgi:hypothetical protein
MKVKLITYRISLTNKVNEKQTLSHFNGQEDLLNTINEFCNYIHKNIKSYTDNVGNRRTFTIDGLQKIEDSKRVIHGFFDSALTGDKMKIKDNDTNSLIYDVKNRDLQSRNFFFFIYVPKNSKYAFLVVQKKSNHGVKNVLENSFNDFLNLKGFIDFRAILEYAPDYNLLNRLIEFGELKEVKLITNKIFSSFDEQFENIEGVENSGTFEETFKFNKTSRSEKFKRQLFNLYKTTFKDYEQINVSNKFYDEVSFLITLNGLSKTFYVKNKAKIRSDADVTDHLDFIDGEPTKNSLLNVSWKLIMTVLGNFDEDENKLAS